MLTVALDSTMSSLNVQRLTELGTAVISIYCSEFRYMRHQVRHKELERLGTVHVQGFRLVADDLFTFNCLLSTVGCSCYHTRTPVVNCARSVKPPNLMYPNLGSDLSSVM